MTSANTTVNSSIPEDWEDLLDMCDSHVELVPFEREPTPTIPITHEDDQFSGEEDDFDAEKSKKLHGMVTYTLRFLGSDYTNSSIETAYGQNGVLLRPESPDDSTNSHGGLDMECQYESQENIHHDPSPVRDKNEGFTHFENLNEEKVLPPDDINIELNMDGDSLPSDKTASSSSHTCQPYDDRGDFSKSDKELRMSPKEMELIASRVKRNTAMSSIMAGLMNRQSSERPKEKILANGLDDAVPVETKILPQVQQQNLNESDTAIEGLKFQTNQYTRLRSVSPLVPLYPSVKKSYNIFDRSVCREQFLPQTSTSVQSTEHHKTVPNKIIPNTTSAKKPAEKLSAEEIYNNLIKNLNTSKPPLAPHYSTDSIAPGSTVKPRSLTVFDVAKVSIAKLKKRKK